MTAAGRAITAAEPANWRDDCRQIFSRSVSLKFATRRASQQRIRVSQSDKYFPNQQNVVSGLQPCVTWPHLLTAQPSAGMSEARLSKKYYGTSHVLSKDEAKFVFERGARSSLLARAKWAMCNYRSLRPSICDYRRRSTCRPLRTG